MPRAGKFVVPPIVVEHSSATPMHRQIYAQIAAAIRDGQIPNGVRLPSSRMMSRMLRVSRNTVLAAFDDLAADGLLRGERGAGMWVSGAPVAEVTWFGLKQVIRDAGYPARVVTLADPDGNPLYLRY